MLLGTLRISLQIDQLTFVGGLDVRDAVRRLISRLLSVGMQTKFNRTGAHDRLSFSDYLEPLIKSKLLSSLGLNVSTVGPYAHTVIFLYFVTSLYCAFPCICQQVFIINTTYINVIYCRPIYRLEFTIS